MKLDISLNLFLDLKYWMNNYNKQYKTYFVHYFIVIVIKMMDINVKIFNLP